jgi:hypothetical protein
MNYTVITTLSYRRQSNACSRRYVIHTIAPPVIVCYTLCEIAAGRGDAM